jgi:hypothetical protein
MGSLNVTILLPYPGTKVYDMTWVGEDAIELSSHGADDFGKRAGFPPTYESIPYGELRRYDPEFLIRYHAAVPIKAIKALMWTRLEGQSYPGMETSGNTIVRELH